jgi:hypothetical protein
MVWLSARLLAHTGFHHHGRRANEIGCLVRHKIRIPYGACGDRCAGYRKHQMSRVHAVRLKNFSKAFKAAMTNNPAIRIGCFCDVGIRADAIEARR